jgi:hypothetical protein
MAIKNLLPLTLLLLVLGTVAWAATTVPTTPVTTQPKTVLSGAEQKLVNEANDATMLNNGFDYGALYAIVATDKGNLDKLLAVCDASISPIYCLKKASQENANLRPQLCAQLNTVLSTKYKNSKPDLAGHKQECLLGISQYAY